MMDFFRSTGYLVTLYLECWHFQSNFEEQIETRFFLPKIYQQYPFTNGTPSQKRLLYL